MPDPPNIVNGGHPQRHLDLTTRAPPPSDRHTASGRLGLRTTRGLGGRPATGGRGPLGSPRGPVSAASVGENSVIGHVRARRPHAAQAEAVRTTDVGDGGVPDYPGALEILPDLAPGLLEDSRVRLPGASRLRDHPAGDEVDQSGRVQLAAPAAWCFHWSPRPEPSRRPSPRPMPLRNPGRFGGSEVRRRRSCTPRQDRLLTVRDDIGRSL